MTVKKEQMLEWLYQAIAMRRREDGLRVVCDGQWNADMRSAIRSLIESSGEKASVPAVEYKLRPEVAAFAMLMEAELRKHDDRPGWKKENVQWLYSRLIDELQELFVAIPTQVAGTIGKEAADVANFAMMIADVSGSLEPRPPAPSPGPAPHERAALEAKVAVDVATRLVRQGKWDEAAKVVETARVNIETIEAESEKKETPAEKQFTSGTISDVHTCPVAHTAEQVKRQFEMGQPGPSAEDELEEDDLIPLTPGELEALKNPGPPNSSQRKLLHDTITAGFSGKSAPLPGPSVDWEERYRGLKEQYEARERIRAIAAPPPAEVPQSEVEEAMVRMEMFANCHGSKDEVADAAVIRAALALREEK
jgi:hypothetical protein